VLSPRTKFGQTLDIQDRTDWTYSSLAGAASKQIIKTDSILEICKLNALGASGKTSWQHALRPIEKFPGALGNLAKPRHPNPNYINAHGYCWIL
jgi:hypothetical protein